MSTRETAIHTPKTDRTSFDLIWRRFPERQIRGSSVWWFFLLFPKQARGYGPKQVMFTFVAVAGDSFRINQVEHPGLGRQPFIKDGSEHLNSMVQGWFFDGQQMHKDIVHQSCRAILSPQGSLAAWTEASNGTRAGGEMRVRGDKPFGLEAEFSGDRGGAHFEVWGDPYSEITNPADTVDYHSRFGGSHVIAWRRLRFAGQFSYPNGAEELRGIGYFQRVCLNVVPFPWKWIWVAFADESVFSCFVPYLGPHVLRRGDRLFPNWLEQTTVPIRATSYFYWSRANQTTTFDQVSVTPLVGESFPCFVVECRSAKGDFLRYRAVPYSHTQNLLERPLLKGLWHSRYNYNEFLFRLVDLSGRVGDQTLSEETLGPGFGNCEYTWGLGLG